KQQEELFDTIWETNLSSWHWLYWHWCLELLCARTRAQIWLSLTAPPRPVIITRRRHHRGLCFSFRQFALVSASARALAITDRGMGITGHTASTAAALIGADTVTGIERNSVAAALRAALGYYPL